VRELTRIDYEDTFSTACPAGTSATDVLMGFFSSEPRIVRVLMALRNGLVSIVGLKTVRPPRLLHAAMLQAGNRAGIFEIASITPHSAVIGADDAHLNFRVLLNIQNEVLSCHTQVQFNNTLGRVYFFFVRPFHRRIVPMMLKASVKSVRPAGSQGK